LFDFLLKRNVHSDFSLFLGESQSYFLAKIPWRLGIRSPESWLWRLEAEVTEPRIDFQSQASPGSIEGGASCLIPSFKVAYRPAPTELGRILALNLIKQNVIVNTSRLVSFESSPESCKLSASAHCIPLSQVHWRARCSSPICLQSVNYDTIVRTCWIGSLLKQRCEFELCQCPCISLRMILDFTPQVLDHLDFASVVVETRLGFMKLVIED